MTKKIRTTKQAAQIRYGILLARYAAPLGFHSEDGKKFQELHGTSTLLNTPFKRAFYFASKDIERKES